MAKAIFITGASSGIGKALALELAGRGYDLFLTARRHEELERLRTEIGRAHPDRRVEVRRLDVTDDADVPRAVEEAAGSLGRLDIVLANAGLGASGPVGSGHFDRDRQIIETNVVGAMATIDAAVALFRRQGGPGQVVGISSVARARPPRLGRVQRLEGRRRGLPRVGARGDPRRADHRDDHRAGLHRHADEPGHEEPAVPDRRREGRADHR
jgi:NADP-dependent 3-hydroxy acid dehydrogenase YdfG